MREIWIRNTDKAISVLISPHQKRAIISKGRGVGGQATIKITSYRTGVDCDQRGYNALLLSVVKRTAEMNAVARSDDAFTC